jgi:hypothetical protein
MRIDLAPRHPARLHDRIDGRSPGSRVTARHRLPGMSQWLCGSGSPLTVAGAAAESELWEPGSRSFTAFPVRSHVRDRRSRSLNGRHRRLVNADGIQSEGARDGADGSRRHDSYLGSARDSSRTANKNAWLRGLASLKIQGGNRKRGQERFRSHAARAEAEHRGLAACKTATPRVGAVQIWLIVNNNDLRLRNSRAKTARCAANDRK